MIQCRKWLITLNFLSTGYFTRNQMCRLTYSIYYSVVSVAIAITKGGKVECFLENIFSFAFHPLWENIIASLDAVRLTILFCVTGEPW